MTSVPSSSQRRATPTTSPADLLERWSTRFARGAEELDRQMRHARER